MQILQAIGPFTAGQEIVFDTPAPKYQIKYIKFGIQAPQVPPLSEITNYEQAVRFKIQGKTFIINANDILEFEDFYNGTIFSIIPLQDMDAYTIIDVGYVDEIDEL